MHVFGENYKLNIFGESHGPLIGASISGLPAGILISEINIQKEMERRRPSQDIASTKRQEKDEVHIVSGVFKGFTTGTPLTILIYNEDRDSSDYEKGKIRPGHSDFPIFIKSRGYYDYRGGGHSSGRLTAPLVAIGAIVKDILKEASIEISSQIKKLHTIEDIDGDILSLQYQKFPVFSDVVAEKMRGALEKAKMEKNSLGGIVRIATSSLPIGLGEPFFQSIESHLSSFLFSVPGVKAVSFGDGFLMSEKRGSEINDELLYIEGKPTLLSNHQGGINGGITNGNPLLVNIGLRPPSTIGTEQRSIHMGKNKNIILKNEGRHDVSIVPRVLPVLEATTALVLFDFLLPRLRTRN